MKTLTSQTWEITREDDDKITVEFERYATGRVVMNIHFVDKVISFEDEQIHELKNIIDSTKFIFNQN